MPASLEALLTAIVSSLRAMKKVSKNCFMGEIPCRAKENYGVGRRNVRRNSFFHRFWYGAHVTLAFPLRFCLAKRRY